MKTVALSWWIGFFLFSVYLLSFSGELHVMDEFVGYAAGNNLVQHGRADVNQFIWTNHWHTTPPGIWGADNNLYTKKAPGISLAAMPLIWLGHTLPGLNAVHLSLLTSAIVTALTGSLLLIWLVDLGLSQAAAAAAALGYGLCTLALVYARFLWEHALVAFLFLLAMWAAYRAARRKRWPWLLLCSAAMALSLTMRFEAAAAVGLLGLYLFFGMPPALEPVSLQKIVRSLRNRRRWLWLGLYSLLPLVTLIGLLYFNLIRFGSISETGYNREILFHRPWEGAFGLLFSPSTGLFIYAPLTLLIFLGIRPAWQRLPRLYVGLIITLALFYWIFYGAWFSWGSTWVWGPRFMLHTLPLLMLFVAELFERLFQPPAGSPLANGFVRASALVGVGLLALAGFMVNFLGVAVDLNEHFLRLGRNDNYVFNWEAFPPLGHWRILQEGMVDVIWLRPGATGLSLDWGILTPALTLFALAAAGLFLTLWTGLRDETKDEKSSTPRTPVPSQAEGTQYAIRNTQYAIRLPHHPLTLIALTLLAVILVYQMMANTAQAAQAGKQAQADAPVLETLSTSAGPDEALLVAMPPFGDVQEISTHLMAYLDEPLPTYAWIESEPKAIQPAERQRVWTAATREARRVWLFERWLTPKDPLSESRAFLDEHAFPVWEQWIEDSGRLALYALAEGEPALTAPVQASFEGGLTLVEFALFGVENEPGEILKVRLTWRAEAGQATPDGLPPGGVVAFVHLIDGESSQNAAQQDRLLLDLQQPKQSPLLPGQTVTQGYGLRLPEELPPGAYPLIAGLYLAESGERLQRSASPDDFIYLTDVIVTLPHLANHPPSVETPGYRR